MDVRKMDNLWKFLSIKNNLPVTIQVDQLIKYTFRLGNMQLSHQFNPKIWQQSTLTLADKDFQERAILKHFHHKKKKFGFQQDLTSTHVQIFFPRAILQLKTHYELEVMQDRSAHFCLVISPFVPKNIYEILDAVNFSSKELWKRNFFSEAIRN